MSTENVHIFLEFPKIYIPIIKMGTKPQILSWTEYDTFSCLKKKKLVMLYKDQNNKK